jgi:hypothetical protein
MKKYEQIILDFSSNQMEKENYVQGELSKKGKEGYHLVQAIPHGYMENNGEYEFYYFVMEKEIE